MFGERSWLRRDRGADGRRVAPAAAPARARIRSRRIAHGVSGASREVYAGAPVMATAPPAHRRPKRSPSPGEHAAVAEHPPRQRSAMPSPRSPREHAACRSCRAVDAARRRQPPKRQRRRQGRRPDHRDRARHALGGLGRRPGAGAGRHLPGPLFDRGRHFRPRTAADPRRLPRPRAGRGRRVHPPHRLPDAGRRRRQAPMCPAS